MRLGAILWLGCVLAFGSARAQEAPATISAVRIAGQQRVDEDAIRMVIRSQPGRELSASQVAEDIRAVFGLGFFSDVRVVLQEEPQGAVLVFEVVEKPSISEIVFRGQKELDLDKIKEVVDIQPTSVLDTTRIRKNAEKIKDLYVEKGFFLAEVGFTLQPLKNNRVRLIFLIEERSKVQVKRITIVGNEAVSDQELKDGMETREGNWFSWLTSFGTYKEEALKRDLSRISDYYYNHGYINVKVGEPLVEINPARDGLYITIPVEEGLQYRFGNLSFAGDLLVPDEALILEIDKALGDPERMPALSPELLRELGKSLSEADLGRIQRETLEELRREAEGRRREKIFEEDQPPRRSADTPREKIRAAMLSQLKVRVLEGMLLIRPGEIFNRMMLGMTMFRIQDTYKDRGYAYVEVVPQTRIDPVSRVVDLTFDIQRGLKVYIERIEIKGNLKTRDNVIRRQMRLYEGELYSGTGREMSERRINQLGFFEKVEIAENRGSGPDRIVIVVTVKERPTGTFQIGAGFSSVENFIATAQISQENLFGRGQTLALMAQLSSLRQFFSLNFVDPYFLDTSWYFAFSVYNMQLDYYSFVREASGGNLTWGYEFIDNWRVSATYTLEHVNTTTHSASGMRIYNMTSSGWTSALQLTLQWDTRDNRLFPTSGHLLQGSIEHASPYTLSENVFTRYSGVARWYFPLFWGFVIKTNLSLGYIASASGYQIPIFERYMLGGIYTIRGYEPRSIGPERLAGLYGRDPESPLGTYNAGGNKQIIGNVELEFPIFPQVNIRGVIFLDAGNSYAEGVNLFSDTYDPSTHGKQTFAGLFWSTGFGFRWFSPIGPLRFEWGIPLTRRPGDKDILFEFTIGNFF